jgi:hypothetical protein
VAECLPELLTKCSPIAVVSASDLAAIELALMMFSVTACN